MNNESSLAAAGSSVRETPLNSASAREAGFHRILVPTDFSAPSTKALHYARALADGEIQLVHVVEPISTIYGFDPLATVLSDEEITAGTSHELERISQNESTAGPQVATAIRRGQAAEQIIALAAEWPADLLVLSTHGRTGLPHLLLGSVAEKVVRHVSCPVLLLRKHEHDFVIARVNEPPRLVLRRILVPTDFSAQSVEAIRFACDFAGRFGGQISLLHSVHVVGFPGVDIEPMVSSAEQRARVQIHELFERNVPAAMAERAMVTVGPPLDEIPKFAASGKFDLIICATHGPASIRYAVFGSTAEGLVRHACCPILVVPSRAASAR